MLRSEGYTVTHALRGGAPIDYRFPWDSIVISMLGVFFVIFITMLYTAGKIKRENIMDALRDDMN